MATQVQAGKQSKDTVPVGKRILRSDQDFTEGMISGYLDYFLAGCAGTPISDVELYRILMDAICRPDTDTYACGYVVSFCEALLEDRDLFARPIA